VVKIGSSVLTKGKDGLNVHHIENIANEISKLKSDKYEFVIVTSGAMAAGRLELNISKKTEDIPTKQAAAAIGQSRLMWAYEKAFSKYGIKVAQLLLTHDDLSERKRYLNARNTLFTLLKYGIIPVVNENDTVAVDEIKFGDNDFLSAAISNMVDADLLFILTDVDGLYDSDPGEEKSVKLIHIVEDVTPEIEKMITSTKSAMGTGGMAAKVKAAAKATISGVTTVIASGKNPLVLEEFLGGKEVGTLFLPKKKPLKSRKHWIGYTRKIHGRVTVDDGAREALTKGGKSLLSSGIISVDGRFDEGDSVLCVDRNGKWFAKGLVNYNSSDLMRIMGKKSKEIEGILGHKDYDEVIHRDNLVIIEK
ncbi:MAG: glutamate 5-kinase, partial [Candidatus Schekmanbacteria bacterium RBG_16_38_10]